MVNDASKRAQTRRDTTTGKLLAEMGGDELEKYWARKIKEDHEKLLELKQEYEGSMRHRHDRRSTRRTIAELEDEEEEETHDPDAPAPDLSNALDLTDYFSWFKSKNPNTAMDDLRFVDAKEWITTMETNPGSWYDFITYLINTCSWLDYKVNMFNEELNAQEETGDKSSLAKKLDHTEKKLKEAQENIQKGRTRRITLKATMTEMNDSIKTLRDEKQELQERLDAAIAQQNLGTSQHDESDDEEFLESLRQPGEHGRRVGFDNNNSSRPSSPGTAATTTFRSSRPPPKVDTFTGEDRDKYQEWYSKLVGQIDAYPEYFDNQESRKLNYLLQHLSGASFDLLEDEYGPRARARKPGLTFDDAMSQLDRAYYPHDTYRTARAKLEGLQMGSGETFAEFYPKFQAQVVRLKLVDEHKVDELTKRLTRRYAEKVLTGVDEPYTTIVNRLYTLDSQFQMYNASRKEKEKDKDGSSKSSGGNKNSSNKSQASKDSTGKGKNNHETMKLGETSKPLTDMTDAELKAYLNGLPHSKTISARCLADGRCHTCHQKGHMKSNPFCPAKRLEKSAKLNTTSTTTDEEEGKVQA